MWRKRRLRGVRQNPIYAKIEYGRYALVRKISVWLTLKVKRNSFNGRRRPTKSCIIINNVLYLITRVWKVKKVLLVVADKCPVACEEERDPFSTLRGSNWCSSLFVLNMCFCYELSPDHYYFLMQEISGPLHQTPMRYLGGNLYWATNAHFLWANEE